MDYNVRTAKRSSMAKGRKTMAVALERVQTRSSDEHGTNERPLLGFTHPSQCFISSLHLLALRFLLLFISFILSSLLCSALCRLVFLCFATMLLFAAVLACVCCCWSCSPCLSFFVSNVSGRVSAFSPVPFVLILPAISSLSLFSHALSRLTCQLVACIQIVVTTRSRSFASAHVECGVCQISK